RCAAVGRRPLALAGCECGNEMAGHIAFSPMMLKGWLDLGPVSAEPALQSHGIGSALILAGLDYLREAASLTGNTL
ncbi:GNAT family N-acetyltransferase, partial [Hyphomonas sp.]|uniref:GNAT family N-acetyltransferase n=1 Tax=Hyphomonas sp. TaxID=87 RepID=UPI0037C03A3F